MASASTRAAVLFGAAPLLALALVLTVPLAERAGIRPWTSEPRTLVEAAAAGEAARVLSLLERGEDPLEVYAVSAGVIGPDIRLATPFEAAVWSGHLGVVQLLESRAALDQTARQSLACLALDRRATAIAAHLGGAPQTCDPGAAEAQVMARTTGVVR
jgi:hypothetical protein